MPDYILKLKGMDFKLEPISKRRPPKKKRRTAKRWIW